MTLLTLPLPRRGTGPFASPADRSPSWRSRQARASVPKPIPERQSISLRFSAGAPQLPQPRERDRVVMKPPPSPLLSGKVHKLVQVQDRMTQVDQAQGRFLRTVSTPLRLGGVLVGVEELAHRLAVGLVREAAQIGRASCRESGRARG